jgi:hypothetical protein
MVQVVSFLRGALPGQAEEGNFSAGFSKTARNFGSLLGRGLSTTFFPAGVSPGRGACSCRRPGRGRPPHPAGVDPPTCSIPVLTWASGPFSRIHVMQTCRPRTTRHCARPGGGRTSHQRLRRHPRRPGDTSPQVIRSTGGGKSHAGPGGQRPSCRTAKNMTGARPKRPTGACGCAVSGEDSDRTREPTRHTIERCIQLPYPQVALAYT